MSNVRAQVTPSLVLQSLDVTAPAIAQQVYTLQVRSYRVEAQLLGVPSLPPLERKAEDLAGLRERFIGAMVGNALAGVASYSEEGNFEICLLVVCPSYHRQGVGSALLHELVRRAGSRSVHVSTAKRNIPAVSLYRKAGFDLIRESVVGKPSLELVHMHRLGSNPSIERTCPGKPGHAAHVERYAP